jgi:hypothetical protein
LAFAPSVFFAGALSVVFVAAFFTPFAGVAVVAPASVVAAFSLAVAFGFGVGALGEVATGAASAGSATGSTVAAVLAFAMDALAVATGFAVFVALAALAGLATAPESVVDGVFPAADSVAFAAGVLVVFFAATGITSAT